MFVVAPGAVAVAWAREPNSTSRIADSLVRQGIAVLCGVSDRAALVSAGRGLMTTRIHRDSDGEGVTTIERRFSAAMGSRAGDPYTRAWKVADSLHRSVEALGGVLSRLCWWLG
jgi:hypothetical protein